jgi:hypothetical protein
MHKIVTAHGIAGARDGCAQKNWENLELVKVLSDICGRGFGVSPSSG